MRHLFRIVQLSAVLMALLLEAPGCSSETGDDEGSSPTPDVVSPTPYDSPGPGESPSPTGSPGPEDSPASSPGPGDTPGGSPGPDDTPTGSPGPDDTPTGSPGPDDTPTGSPGPDDTPPGSPGPDNTPTGSPGPDDSPIPGDTEPPDESPTPPAVDADKDGYGVSVDCDDHDPSIHPGATETCDGADQDCDGTVDEGLNQVYYFDQDKDTYGNPASTVSACGQPVGYVSTGGDCDDTDAAIHPGALETCDSKDNDCDAAVDEGLNAIYYLDQDKDTYGNSASTVAACSQPVGYAARGGDCDDTSANIYPGALEACDGKDNDCDSQIDEGATTRYYHDNDGDGYGNPNVSTLACTKPAGYVLDNTDCNDSNSKINPGAAELCDGIDNDCDTTIDEGVQSTYYRDQDGDHYGDASNSILACNASAGYVADNTDCDDTSATTYPGATELCDAVDNDCDGAIDDGISPTWFRDQDGDGFGVESVRKTTPCTQPSGYVPARGDCNDSDKNHYPGATDGAGDGKDQDCGGTTGADPHVGLSGASYASIRDAIYAASSGQTVWVGPGTYKEYNVGFGGKAVTLISTRLADATIVDAAKLGRVVYFGSGETASTVLDGFTLKNGLTGADGGGISIISASPTIRGCVVESNIVQEPYVGGGISVNGGSPVITGCTIRGNQATYGGGISLKSATTAYVSSCLVTGNAASINGGGIDIYKSSPTVTDCVISYNEAETGGGGNMYQSAPALSGLSFVLNEAQDYGGGLNMTSSSAPSITNCAFNGNTASWGGGLSMYTASAPVLTSVLFEANAASVAGGAVNVDISSPSLTNCTLVNNSCAAGAGGGLCIVGSTAFATVTSGIIAYNTGYNVYNDPGNKGTATISYTDLYASSGNLNHNLGVLAGTNLTTEPGFLTYASGTPSNYHLAKTSGLVNRGATGGADPDGTRIDPGIYGGAYGGSWDVDLDGVPDWFWPGKITEPPSGFDPNSYDCDDRDAAVQLCNN